MNWQRVTTNQISKYIGLQNLKLILPYLLVTTGEGMFCNKERQPIAIHNCKHYAKNENIFVAYLNDEEGELKHKDCETSWGAIIPFLILTAKFEEAKK